MTRPFPALALAMALAACGSTRMEAPNCSGTAQPANAEGLAPVVYDDGRDTFLRFPGNQRIPAITTLRLDGSEAAVNSNGNPDTGIVQVHGVHPAIVLRDGRRVACLRNMAYDQVGVRPAGGAR